MFIIHYILDIFDYICAQKAHFLARLTKSDMEIQRYNRLKAAIEQVQSEVHFNSAEREQARRFSLTARKEKSTQFKIVLAEKEQTGTWLFEQMGQNISPVSCWMTNRSALWDACQSKKVQPSVEQLYDIAKHFDVNVRELLVASK